MQVRGVPHYASGIIVKGFGRGSRELGIPTANYPLEVVQQLPSDFGTGIYYGWATVDNGPVYKMVMSIGWNPYYHNKEKSMETYILHKFEGDLYGSLLKICICGFIRPELDFESVEALIARINEDIEVADQILDGDEHKATRDSDFFRTKDSDSTTTPTATTNGDQHP